MYPRIIIAAATNAEALKLQRQLRKRGIFTEISDFDGILKLKEAPALIIVLSKTYSSRAYASLLHAKSHLSGTKTFVIGDASDYASADVDLISSYTLADKGNCISGEISRVLDRSFTFAERGNAASDVSDSPFVYFRGTHLFLSETEANIVHILASFDADIISAETFAIHINIQPKSVSAYVSSINKKALALTRANMIFSHRGKGYSLFPPES